MKIIAAIIGMGVGQKHLEAIENYKNFYVKIICEKNYNKIKLLKKKYPSKKIVRDENEVFKDKEINLVSIASYDEFHFPQIIKGLNNNKNLVIEKPMCLTQKELNKIHMLLKKKN